MSGYAPIVLFVYNRPDHTRRTVEALLQNAEACESKLFIFSDAPKKPEAADAVREVRNYIRTIAGFRSVSIVERETNWGLAASIIDGVTSIVNKYGRIIVLEDDMVTSSCFLRFMNDALDEYEKKEKVMHISGYMFPIDNKNMPETFFLRTASCWGWATWNRAWRYFEKNPQKLIGEFTEHAIQRFNLDGTYDFWAQVEKNVSGEINTWAVFWYASIFGMGGVCLHPKYSLVNNIGHDKSGVHCAGTDRYDTKLANSMVSNFESCIEESVQALDRTKSFFLPPRPSFFDRASKKLNNLLFHS